MRHQSVSVIIPAYQSARTIARPLASLRAQTRPPDEILVIDDGSTDDLAAAMSPFSSHARLITKPNGGAASARNLGIEHARSEWIAFLDADDYWEPSKLERQLAASEGVGLIGARWFTENPGKPRVLSDVSNEGFFGRAFKPCGSEAFRVAMHIWTGVVLVRRSILSEQRFVSGLEPAEDRDLWIRLAASTSVYLVPEPLATYVQYENSLSNSDSDRDCSNMLKVVRRHAALLGAKGLREQEAKVYRSWVWRNLGRGRPRSAIKPAARRLAIQPTSAQAWWTLAKVLCRSIVS